MPRVDVRSPYEFKVTYTPSRPLTKFSFSLKEIEHLAISAVLVMGVGLSIMFSYFRTSFFDLPTEFYVAASVMFVVLFLLHEIAHKLVAQHYGLWAEFRLIMFGAVLTLLSAFPFSPFKVIAPGAMMIAGQANQQVMGKTAVAGPLTNLVLSVVSLTIAFSIPSISSIAYLSSVFNAWIALINTLPILMLDGLKIFRWNKIVWAFVFAVALALTIATFFYV